MAERVTDYLDGALSASSWLGTRVHLFICPSCRRYFDQMRKTIRLLADVPPPPPPEGVADKVIAAVRRDGSRPATGD
jgi:anti-sigma factor RsiW